MKYFRKYYVAIFCLTFIFADQYEINVEDLTYNVNYLIISPDSFRTQALQLAEYRSLDNLQCAVVSIDSIFALNTYSAPDSALKAFIKKVWANNSTKLRYAIILGDWDIVIPHKTYQTYSDSVWYFDNWYTTNLDSSAQSEYDAYFSIGRIPAESSVQLQWYIDRLIRYENQVQILPWQNRVFGLAGEKNGTSNCLLDYTTLRMGEIVENVGLDFSFISKCEDSEYYESNHSVIKNNLTMGSVLTFYNGFNTYYQWENDSLLTFNNVVDLDFWNYSPILLTSGNRQYCFRDSLSSIAKKMFVESIDGPVSMFSTANPLTLISNDFFNNKLIANIISDDEARIGDSFVKTNNENPSMTTYMFQLFGDPALKPQIIKNENQIIEPFSFELSVNEQQPFISMYPTEEWTYFRVPLSHYNTVFYDSLEEIIVTQINIGPYFVSDSIPGGNIIIDDLSIGDSYFEDFENSDIEWRIVTRGNKLNFNFTDDTPSESGKALGLEFNRSVPDSVFSTVTIIFDSPITLTLADTIGLWIKRGKVNLDIKSPSNIPPTDYRLFRPYPNPFNPILTIEFYVPEYSKVKISVYDILGREVDVIMNGELPAGNYRKKWDGSSFASGVYFITMISKNYVKTEKALLLK